MSNAILPPWDLINHLVKPYFQDQTSGLGFAIGCATQTEQRTYFFGSTSNQFGTEIDLDGNTPFELASISKTFTATLYAAIIKINNADQTLSDYISPTGPLNISHSLGEITLDSLMSYSSGLPQDNETDENDSPPYLPMPYGFSGMLSYLDADPPTLSSDQYLYSNLGFAIMSAVLSRDTVNLSVFEQSMEETIFTPLSMKAKFFGSCSLERLPLGYDYDYSTASVFFPTGPGWSLFPAYYGAGGIVASPDDMMAWLTFNMGLNQNISLNSVLQYTQNPATTVTWGDTRLGLGWFLSPATSSMPATVWKDGGLNGTNTYILFAASADPGVQSSEAGVYVMINADGMTSDQTNSGTELPAYLATRILAMMLQSDVDAPDIVYRSTRRKRSRP